MSGWERMYPPGMIPEEQIVHDLRMQKEQLEEDAAMKRRRASAIVEATNLRGEITKLGGTPVK